MTWSAARAIALQPATPWKTPVLPRHYKHATFTRVQRAAWIGQRASRRRAPAPRACRKRMQQVLRGACKRGDGTLRRHGALTCIGQSGPCSSCTRTRPDRTGTLVSPSCGAFDGPRASMALLADASCDRARARERKGSKANDCVHRHAGIDRACTTCINAVVENRIPWEKGQPRGKGIGGQIGSVHVGGACATS